MGAGIWLDTILCRLRHTAGDRAARLRGAAAMTRNHFSPIGYGTPMNDIVERLRSQRTPALFETAREAADEIERLRLEIERLTAELARIRGLPRLAALDAEIERLNEQVAALQAASGYEASIAQVEIERLTAWLQEIAREQDATDADYFRAIARAALAGQPLAGKERKP